MNFQYLRRFFVANLFTLVINFRKYYILYLTNYFCCLLKLIWNRKIIPKLIDKNHDTLQNHYVHNRKEN